jgi:hypothetical protein
MVSIHIMMSIAVLAHCAAGAVLTWTVICLAIAAHFQSLLVITDLSEFTLYFVVIGGSCSYRCSSVCALCHFRMQRQYAHPHHLVSIDPEQGAGVD